MIWFRIEYNDADKYIIKVKLGSLTFASDIGYDEKELVNVVKELIKVDTDMK